MSDTDREALLAAADAAGVGPHTAGRFADLAIAAGFRRPMTTPSAHQADGGEHGWPGMDEDEADAARTRCQKCDEPYEVVRPGKIQPSCDCEYIAGLNRDLDEAIAAHESACSLVAKMHEAAVGSVRGPIRGVVEDVADLRAARDAAVEAKEKAERELAELRTSPAYADKAARSALAAAQAEAGRWIAVGDQDVDADGEYLICYDAMSGPRVTLAVRQNGRWDGYGNFRTHWRPLPAPPARAALDAGEGA